MGKKHKKQANAGNNALGINHQHDPLTRFSGHREKYVTSDLPAPADFDNYMISIRNFTLDQIGRMRLVCNDATLSLLYNHCHTTPNLMDTHGFTPDDITRIMRVQGCAHNLMAVFNHIDALKAYCDNDKDKIVALASFTGASCSITAICSDMSATLSNTHGFSMAQLVDVVARVGGKRKLELLHKYAAAVLQMNIGHEDIVSIVKQAISAEAVELALREKLVSVQESLHQGNTGADVEVIVQPPIIHQDNNNAAANQQDNNNATMNQPAAVNIDMLSVDDTFQFYLDEIFNTSIGDIPPHPQATGQLFITQWNMPANRQSPAQDKDEDEELGALFEWGSAFK